MKKLLLLFVLVLYAAYASAALLTGNATISQYNTSGLCLDFSNTTVNSTANCDLYFYGDGSLPDEYRFNASSGNYLLPVGPYMSVSTITQVPLYGTTGGYGPSYNSEGRYYQAQDGIAFYFSGTNTYGFMVLDTNKQPSGGSNINPQSILVSYVYNNQSGNTSMGGDDVSACAQFNQDQCISNIESNCWWDFGVSLCKQNQGGEIKNEGHFADCYMFGANLTACAMINTCYVDGTNCEKNNTNFDYMNGIECGNISSPSLCNKIKVLDPLCSWVGASCVKNYSKQMSPPPVWMCSEALDNQLLCGQLINDYMMPCVFNASGSNKCSMDSSMMCDGPKCHFEDMQTETNCQAIGGLWRSETYTYADSYGQTKTKTENWCEMGFSKESCDDACYACEGDVSQSQGNSTVQARTHCENSALGFCQFFADANAFNGLGWCDMKREMFCGTGQCSTNCFDCNFMNNPETACNASVAGCRWFTDPYDSINQWCDSASVRGCEDDCFMCYDNNSCSSSNAKPDKDTQAGCTWNTAQNICKFQYDLTKEICFNGLDDDSDGTTDCKDNDCMYNPFCGGDNLVGGNEFVDCWEFDTNKTQCEAYNESCIFIDMGFEAFCERRGEHCFFAYMDPNNPNKINSTSCSNDLLCQVNNQPRCEINKSMAKSCILFDENQSGCNNLSYCKWYPEDNICDFKIFDCFENDTRRQSETECEDGNFCVWHTDTFSGGGFCNPICMNMSANNDSLCNALSQNSIPGACAMAAETCDPNFIMGDNCFLYNGNVTGCYENNMTCMWIPGPDECVDKFMMEQFEGMDTEPVMLGTDTMEDSLQVWVDIVGFGVMDSKKSMVFGIPLVNISTSVICSGGNDATYYLYLDTSGKNDDNCIAYTASGSETGFEFYFKLQGQDTSIVSVAYKCINGNWAPAPLTFQYKTDLMCTNPEEGINGPMFGIEKQDLKKNLLLYNATANFRMIGVAVNSTDNRTNPTDSIGPIDYTPGSIGKFFEDCETPGQDMDGDGFDSENDPDCQKFKKFGYVPMEVGPQCGDNKDNDGNGLVDCADGSCMFDPFFCSGYYNSSADKTAPSILWHKSKGLKNMFFIDFDTNEPTNGTLFFYNNNSCTSALNNTYYFVPPGADSVFFPWHHIEVPGLSRNTTYFYKVKVIDPAGNIAKSGCMNVTTGARVRNITVAFNFAPVQGLYNTQCLGTLYYSFDWGNTGTWDVENSTMLYGIKINETRGLNSTIRFASPNASQSWSISLVGVDISSAISSALSNLSSVFFANCTLSDPFIGMDSDKFVGIIQSLRPDYLLITIPNLGSILQHCDEDNISRCSDVTGNVTQIANGTDYSTWRIPVKTGLGFSVYSTDTTPSPPVAPGGGTPSGGGGGGSLSYQCNDKKDNDGDGLIDYPDDPGCSKSTDTTEAGECVQRWICTTWGKCKFDNTQTRLCVDKNNCGTDGDKPSEIKSCRYVEPDTIDQVVEKVPEVSTEDIISPVQPQISYIPQSELHGSDRNRLWTTGVVILEIILGTLLIGISIHVIRTRKHK
ncbi:MAG: hypothetical protein ABIC04_05470 [Nanoarchaeota archaeon]